MRDRKKRIAKKGTNIVGRYLIRMSDINGGDEDESWLVGIDAFNSIEHLDGAFVVYFLGPFLATFTSCACNKIYNIFVFKPLV